MAVSYTHLDVYKRQQVYGKDKLNETFDAKAEEATLTNMQDVYKRQFNGRR